MAAMPASIIPDRPRPPHAAPASRPCLRSPMIRPTVPRLTRHLRPLAMAAAIAAAALPAAAETVSGIDYPSQSRVAEQTLHLNGAGVRYKFVVPVYTAGLYLATPASTAEAALAAAGPKRLHIVMLRDINATELGKLFTRGMEDNSSRADFVRSINGTLRLAEMFSAKRRLAAGEHFSVEWWPGKGTQILVNGRPQGAPIVEPEFFQALMRIWLGPHPADALLKERLLGQSSAPTPGALAQGN
jgi:hypothetical protein